MGYTYRNNGDVTDYWPDDSENEFYIAHGTSFSVIIDACRDKWGQDINFDDISITPENIHTHCLTYDSHDSGDYTQFLRIELHKE